MTTFLLPSINHIKQRSVSQNKPKSSKNNDFIVPTLTKYGQEQKREQDEYIRVNTLEREVNQHIEFVKERAKKANEIIDKEIVETTIMLQSCDIRIGQLQTKLEKVQSQPTRKQHEKELAELQAKRTRKALQKQQSIEEKKLFEGELNELMKLGKPIVVENKPKMEQIDGKEDSDKQAIDDQQLFASNKSTTDGEENETAVDGEVYTEKQAKALVRQLTQRQKHELRCTCAECVKVLNKTPALAPKTKHNVMMSSPRTTNL